jgi:hypothetical protein
MNTTPTMNTTPIELKTAQSLVLCYYATTAPATTALNRSASARAISSAGASRNAARVYNEILTSRGTAIGRAISLQQKTGVAIRRLGLPCPSGGIYLRIRDIPEAQNLFDDAQIEMDQVREDILATYGDLVAALRDRLGAFVHEVRIPSATEVASRFTMTLTIVNSPAPVTNSVLTGLSTEVANRVRADSQRQIDEMLRASHAGPIADLKKVLAEFIDKMRNAERLHLTQFDKLRKEAKRVKDLNVLNLPEIDAVVRLAAAASTSPVSELTDQERVNIAIKAEKASAKADETLASLGL